MVSRAGEKFFLPLNSRGWQWPCKGLKPDAEGGGGGGAEEYRWLDEKGQHEPGTS